MIQKVVALFFILFASIVLLVNAAIPHHHHDTDVCFISTHCETDGETHKHGTTEHKHDHHGENNTDFCALEQVFIIPAKQAKQEHKISDYPDLIHIYKYYQDNLYNQTLISLIPIYLSKAKHSLIIFSYSILVNRIQGLRAPPFV